MMASEIISSVDSSSVRFEADTTKNIQTIPAVTTCGYYKFIPRDTLYYHVVSNDSIVIDYGTPLLKNRSELLRVICDSVGNNNHFYMNLSLMDCYTQEYESGSKDTAKHSSSEWLNRSVYIELDSVGTRFQIAYDDSTKLGFTPGGAFAPYLFFDFQKPCSDTGMSYNARTEMDYLVENGLPCPFLRSAYLFTNHGSFDTLGFKTNRLEYVKTSQGSVIYGDGASKLRLTNIIAAGGILDIGTELRVPVHLFQTQEQKLTFHKVDESTIPGMHYSNSFFTLVNYREYKPAKTTDKAKQKKSRSKSKKKTRKK